MTDWIATYSASLKIRDVHEQAHKTYIDAYTVLADRTASALALPQTTTIQAEPTSTPAKTSSNRSPGREKPALPTSTAADPLTALRADLTTTQRARTALATRVEDLTAQLAKLQQSATTSASTIAALTRQKAEVERKLRDREEELRGKDRLVVRAQDEQVALNLQLHFAEKREAEAKAENAELVARWMERMGREAEMVNRESRWE